MAPSTQFNQLRNEISRLLEDPFSLMTPDTSFFEGWTPAIEVYEDQEKITVKAEIPGMEPKDIEVSLDGNNLIISGERKEEQENREGETYRSERFFGRFQRSITLPTSVDQNKIQANYKDGVLCIELPKAEEARRKQIPVQTSQQK